MIGFEMDCGGRGIRTPGPRERTTVFKTAAFDHSAISPLAQKYNIFWKMPFKTENFVLGNAESAIFRGNQKVYLTK